MRIHGTVGTLLRSSACPLRRSFLLASSRVTIANPLSSSKLLALRDGNQQTRNTTILCVRKEGKVALVGDGLVTQGNYKVKPNALKVRTIGKDKNMVLCGFAGVTADCLALLERLEMKLEEYPGQLVRASVELAKNWRLDKMMRQLNATVVVANGDAILELTGNGDCFEPHDGVLGIGSGGAFASAAARAFVESGTSLSAREIALKSCQIASDMDTATNNRFVIEEMECNSPSGSSETDTSGDSSATPKI